MIPLQNRTAPSPGDSSPHPIKFFLQYSSSPILSVAPHHHWYHTITNAIMKRGEYALTLLDFRFDITIIRDLINIALFGDTKLETCIFS